jgi:WD40 repeat protein
MRKRLVGRIDAILDRVAVTADGRVVVAAPSLEGPIVAWDTVSRTRLWTVEIVRGEELTVPGETGYVSDMAVTSDGRLLVIASEDHSLTVRDIRTGDISASFVGDSAMLACAVTSDPVTILAGERSGRLHFLQQR